MKYNLKKPCSNCPLLRDNSRVNLRHARIIEIDACLTDAQGGTFPCHKTVDFDGESDDERQHCAGGIIYSLKQGSPNQITRIAMRLKMFDPEELMKHRDLVFDDLSEWLHFGAIDL